MLYVIYFIELTNVSEDTNETILIIAVISLPGCVLCITCYYCNGPREAGCMEATDMKTAECPTNITRCLESAMVNKKTKEPSEYSAIKL